MITAAANAHALHAAGVTAAAQATILNVAGITTLLGGLFGIVLLSLGIRFGWRGHRGDMAGVMMGLAVVIAALFTWGIAHGNLNGLGNTIAHLFVIF